MADFGGDAEAFRLEARTWLEENFPQSLKDAPMAQMAAAYGGVEERADAKLWRERMGAKGWGVPTWPKQYGGGGLSPAEARVLQEEMARVGAINPIGGMGVIMFGPTLLEYGSEDQKQRHIPPIVRGELRWCQGYSEPGAGSDLASIQTRAVEDGDDFVVNGQKIWTSQAQFADMIFMLVRTDPDAPKHKGISYLLVDMHSPGVTVRPLVEMTGNAGFNEVFFEDVRAPKKNLVGEKNQGWQVAMTTLMFERSGVVDGGAIETCHKLAELARKLPRDGSRAWDDASVRQRVAEFYGEAVALKYTGYRQLTRRLKGLPPGPEGSMMKLCATELNHRMQLFAMELLGPYSQLENHAEHAYDEGIWSFRMLASRGGTIAAGSNQIQHNIIGERVLGLPKG